jgi:predicted RNA-binding Zn-ribbon protein involved in translation (DUF1610 family)
MAEKQPDPPGMYRGYKEIDISRYVRLKHATVELEKRWGPGPWDRDKVVDLMREREADKVQALLDSVARPQAQNIARGKQMEIRTEKYRSAFPDVTPNDEVLITQLVEIELQLDELTEDARMAALTEDGDNLTNKGKRSKMRLELIAEHRRIQNELGIARSKRQDELDSAKVITDTAKRAQALLAGRSTRIECPKCKGEHVVNQGFILFHFAKHMPWKWTSTCPNCGAEIVIEGKKRAQPN